mgnify:CR=1 FL=1|jgi:hypothetical protein
MIFVELLIYKLNIVAVNLLGGFHLSLSWVVNRSSQRHIFNEPKSITSLHFQRFVGKDLILIYGKGEVRSSILRDGSRGLPK